MSETPRDIFVRAHTVVLDQPKAPKRSNRAPPVLSRWPDFALVFSCESRHDLNQEPTFGFYRVLRLEGESYVLEEEGGFFDESLRPGERKVLAAYFEREVADTTSFPPHFPLRSRSEFVKDIFYKYARTGAQIVGFDICSDLARLARKWSRGDKSEWSLVLSVYPDGNENLNHPRVLVNPLDNRKAFIQFRSEWIAKDETGRPSARRTDIDKARFLDLRTLLSALFDQTLSLKDACELSAFVKYDSPQVIDHVPTGEVSRAEIESARHKVRCIAALLNASKCEFDLHRSIRRSPAHAYSPASFVKSYLEAMGIKPPAQKFAVPNEILGYAMESFTAGRSETRVRHVELPIAPLDFLSEYPTVCVLLQLMDVLTAKRLTFEEATTDVQELLRTINLEKCFNRKLWPRFRFFALIKPERDLLPVRTMYSGLTQGVGNSYLTDEKPIWVAGPDLVNSVLNNNAKVPRILRAIRLAPHGKQPGLRPVSLRGSITIDPRRDDLFRKVVEERQRHESDPDLYHWLKIFANSIYGCFVEINPETLPRRKSARVHVYSGEESYIPRRHYQVVERQGDWYAPYLASLITAGGRLLLGMLERCVADKRGVYAWADTDALAVVSSDTRVSLDHIPGCADKRALSRIEVQQIVNRFAELNPYKFGGSILRFSKYAYVGSDPQKGFRQLLGFAISAKRYCLYERDGDKIAIIDPKAHGLGFLYPPANSPEGWDDEHEMPKWIYESWEFLLRMALRLKAKNPVWLKRPQMMRMTVTSNDLLKRLHRWNRFRPYSIFFLPVLADAGYPANVDPARFTLATQFEEDQSKWINSVCLNIDEPKDKNQYRLTNAFDSRQYGERAVAETYEGYLHRYLYHPESKSLAPSGIPCGMLTFGLLGRIHIIAGKRHRIGKEVDRRWEEGDVLEATRLRPIEYERASRRAAESLAEPGLYLSRLVKEIGIRKLNRQGLGRRILEKISRRQLVKASTLQEYQKGIEQYARTTRHRKRRAVHDD